MENKTPEQLAKEFIDSMSEDDIQSIKNAYKEAIDSITIDAKKELEIIEKTVSELETEKKETTDIGKRSDISDKVRLLNKRPYFYKNLIKAYENNGDSVSFTDKRDVEHKNIPNFCDIKTDNIIFNEETLLVDDVPSYIPFIDEDVFRQKGYVFDSIRVSKNIYILAVNGYKEKGEWRNRVSSEMDSQHPSIHPSDDIQGYCMVTLDQLVLINDYYYTKARAIKIKEANERNIRSEEHYDKLPVERRTSFLNQKNYYHSLPKNVQKKITKEDYELLDLQAKEALYKPFKKYNPERLKPQLESNQMWASFHAMYERFINPEALPMTKDRKPISINENRVGIYGNPEVFTYWNAFAEMMKWKLKDIKIAREAESEIRKIALETSFGESNTNLELKEKYGILVKRQNGSQIQPTEINQIKESWIKVQSLFGGISTMALSDNLKISHTAERYVYASKAAGMYIPKMKTIAVSNKYGAEKFQCIMAHEIAHYIDNKIGEQKGMRYSTDNYEGTAGIIASKYRKLLNEASDSDYINATKECFARAMEQYFAVETFGENVSYYESKQVGEILYFNAESYINKKNYDETIKPLIQQFLEEEKDFFKYIVELDSEKPFEITKEIETTLPDNELQKSIETFEMLIELGGTDEEIKEWTEAVETFKMLLGSDKFENGGEVKSGNIYYTEKDMDGFTNLLNDEIRKAGYLTRTSKSKTNFGKSNYVFATNKSDNLYTSNEIKVRVSDHSVTNFDRIMNEYHIIFPVKKSDYNDVANGVVNYVKFNLDRDKYFYSKEVDLEEKANNVLAEKPNNTDVITKEWVTKKGKQMYEVTRTYKKKANQWIDKDTDKVYTTIKNN